TAEWNQEVEAEMTKQREAAAPRLWPEIPARRYLCFYPMNKLRGEAKNWYSEPIIERQRMMREHGRIGRHYAGRVTQNIPGSMRLQNKVAIVTGAAHGIGKAYARGFAQEGAHLVIADVDRPGGEAVAKALVDSGLSAWARTTDVRSFADVEGLMRETVDRFG